MELKGQTVSIVPVPATGVKLVHGAVILADDDFGLWARYTWNGSKVTAYVPWASIARLEIKDAEVAA